MRCTKNELNFEEYINIEIESMVGRLRDFVAAGASIDSTGVSQFVDISHKTIPAILFPAIFLLLFSDSKVSSQTISYFV